MRKWTKNVFVVLAALVLSIGMTLGSNETVNAKPVILKFANYHPQKQPITGEKGVFGYFARQVEELSKGKVKVKIYYGQSLLKAREQVDGVRKKIADVSWSAYALDPRLALVGVTELPFYYPSYDALYEVTKATQSIWEKDFKNLGLKVLFTFPVGFYQLFSNRPIEKIEDLKGLRTRVPGGLMTRSTEALGATPIKVSVPEMYTAFQRGMLKATFNIPSSALALHIYEVSKYLILTNSWTASAVVFINNKTFESLPKDTQDILVEAGQVTERFGPKRVDEASAEAIKLMVAKGMKYSVIPAKERARWKASCGQVVSRWLQKSGEQGKKELAIAEKIMHKYE